MEFKYIAALMKKTVIKENVYIFNLIQVIVGYYDQDNQIFIDDCGNQYFTITDQNFLFSEEEYAISSITTYDQVKNLAKIEYNISIYELKGPYLDHYKNITYYVMVNKGEVYYLSVNIEKVNKLLNEYIRDKKNNQSNLETSELENYLLRNLTAHQQDISTLEEENDVIEFRTTNDNGETDESFDNFISEIEANEYSIEELKAMQEGFSAELKNIELLVDTITHQIETLDMKDNKLETNEENKESKFDLKILYDKLRKTVIGQDEPILRLITEIYRMRSSNSEKKGILLTGQTGVGKTLTMTLMAKYIDRDFYLVDSTQITVPGYTGKNIEQILWEIYEKCDRNKERTENAIIYFDEIDKKGSDKKSDIAGQGVLSVLLKFMDGTTYKACQNPQQITSDTSVDINTSNMIIITGGAFTDVYENLKETTLGFNSENQKEKLEPKIDDFVEKGMMTKEYMARHPIVIHMNTLTREIHKRILLESNESPLKKEVQTFAEEGVKLSYTDDYITTVTEKSYSSKSGARGLKKIIADTTWRALAEVCFNPNVYQEIILTEETVKDNQKYKAVKYEQNVKEKVYTYQNMYTSNQK